MTVTIKLKDSSFSSPVNIFGLPRFKACQVFSLFSESVESSVVNYGQAGPGVVIGSPDFNEQGMLNDRTDWIMTYPGTEGRMSDEGNTQIVAFRVERLSAGALTSISKRGTSPTHFLLTGVGTLDSIPAPSDTVGLELAEGGYYIASLTRNLGDGAPPSYLRLHNADGSIVVEKELTTFTADMSEAIFDAGRNREIGQGGSRIAAVGCFSARMSRDEVIDVAKIMGSITS